jgi:hypothetical protein
VSHSSDTRWKASAPIDGLPETLVALSEQRASAAEVARLENALAAQLATPTRSLISGGAGAASWLSFGRTWPWVSAVLLGLAATWQLMPRGEVSAPAVVEAPPARVLPAAPAVIAAPAAVHPEPPPREPVPAVKSAAKHIARIVEEPARVAPIAPASAEEELALLRRAQSALNRSASTALTLADEHAQLYPNGIFVQEREMLRIEAELTLGKRREALERAHAFAERFGSSTYRARIDRLLEAHRSLKERETPEAERTE